MLCLAACAQQPTQQAAPPAAAPTPAPSDAQAAPGQWTVARTRCSVLLGASDDDRSAAVMFYYGYLAAKANIKTINVANIEGNIAKVMTLCASKPDITVPDAFRQALRPKAAAK
jgi:hypothetical protein